MRPLAMVLASLCGAALLHGSPASGPRPRRTHAARSVVESFVLERPDPQSGRPRSVGWMELVRSRRGGNLRLEQELYFSEEDLSIWHVEEHARGGRRLVWRESGPQALRTWIAELPTGAGSIEIESWGLGQPNQRRLEGRRRLELPLEWLEAARVERPAIGRRRWLSPVAAGVEVVEVEARDPRVAGGFEIPVDWQAQVRAEPTRAWRAYRARRLDGTEAGRWLFRGRRLAAVEWQSAGLRARRLEPEESARPERFVARRAEPTEMEHLRAWLDLVRSPRVAARASVSAVQQE